MKDLEAQKKDVEKLNNEIDNLENFINSCPEGKLIARAKPSGSHCYYVKRKDARGKMIEQYLNREQMPIAESLAKKEYAIACVKDKKNEKWFLEQSIAHDSRQSEAENLLLTKPGIARLVIPTLKEYDDYVEKWKKAKYTRSDFHAEYLTVPTVVPDLFVRSKSECLITSCFVRKGVPFRYEEAHQFGDVVLHPDFTCMNPYTHEIFYLEHYGKIDDPVYVANQRRREDQYRKFGIFLWKNLLMTTETDDQPLDLRWLEKIVDYYLLSRN